LNPIAAARLRVDILDVQCPHSDGRRNPTIHRFSPAILALLVGLACGPELAAQAGADNWQPGSGWTMVWSDEFTGSTVNPANWTYDLGGGGWGNNELETYTVGGATVQDGELRITARKNTDGSYTSARLKTQGRQSWTYGKFAARLRLPQGQGIWPAFWMLGDNIATVGWPKCGEIDIMEMIGGGENRDDSAYGTIHWDANGHASVGSSRIELVDPEIFHDDYHVFEVEWSPTTIVWKIDAVETARVSIDRAVWPEMEEFHRPFFILLNVAVGGNWPGSPDASTVFPQTLAVDWVRVYSSAAMANAPTFTTQPVGQSVSVGQSVTFSVAVSGAPAPTIQWQKDGVDIAGATGTSFQISQAAASDVGTYRAVATNSQGSATSNGASLGVTAAPAPPAPPPAPPAGGGGGGGGGAPSLYLPTLLLLLCLLRSVRPAAGRVD
jgi:beta-glucanase (GH16 family)